MRDGYLHIGQYIDARRDGAAFSDDGVYRYLLWRDLDDDLAAPAKRGPMLAVMLNPSTADETANDPTVERMERRARRSAHDKLVVCNAYALRSTDPSALAKHPDPVGAENGAFIEAAAARADLVICGWGRHCGRERAERVLSLIRDAGRTPHALRVLKGGVPGHPLYVPYSNSPMPLFGGGAV